jgi:hypothetical protein
VVNISTFIPKKEKENAYFRTSLVAVNVCDSYKYLHNLKIFCDFEKYLHPASGSEKQDKSIEHNLTFLFNCMRFKQNKIIGRWQASRSLNWILDIINK